MKHITDLGKQDLGLGIDWFYEMLKQHHLIEV